MHYCCASWLHNLFVIAWHQDYVRVCSMLFVLQTGGRVSWHQGSAGYCAGQAEFWRECRYRILLNIKHCFINSLVKMTVERQNSTGGGRKETWDFNKVQVVFELALASKLPLVYVGMEKEIVSIKEQSWSIFVLITTAMSLHEWVRNYVMSAFTVS